MGYEQGSARKYQPRALGNRDRARPIEVDLRTPTERDHRRIMAKVYERIDVKALAKEAIARALDRVGEDQGERLAALEDARAEAEAVLSIEMGKDLAWQEFAIELCVTAVRVYEHRGKEIKTAGELAEFGQTEIIQDIANEIFTEASFGEEEKKTSAGSTGSGGAETPPSGGTAPNASPPDSIKSADAA